MSNCADRIETAKGLMQSIKRAHDAEMKIAIDLIANLVELCESDIPDPEDVSIIRTAKAYLDCDFSIINGKE